MKKNSSPFDFKTCRLCFDENVGLRIISTDNDKVGESISDTLNYEPLKSAIVTEIVENGNFKIDLAHF